MLLHPSLRLVESSDAAQRLAEARGLAAAHAAGRGVADRLGIARRRRRSRARCRGRPGRRDRLAPLQLHAARRASRGAGPRRPRHRRRSRSSASEAVAARATFEAPHDGELRLLRAGRAHARLPARARPHAPRADARPGRRRGAARRCRSAAPTSRRCSSVSTSSSPPPRRRIAPRCSRPRREAAATYRELPLLLLDVPMESAVEFAFARRLIAAAPDVLITVPFGDLATLDQDRRRSASSRRSSSRAAAPT